MRYLLLVSHGDFAPGLAVALQMLVGKRDDIHSVSFRDGMTSTAFREEVKRVISPIQAEDEVLVLADLIAGSPLTTTMELLSQHTGLALVRAIGGMSLPMAVTAIEDEDEPLDQAVQDMMECAKDQVRLFQAEAGSDDDI